MMTVYEMRWSVGRIKRVRRFLSHQTALAAQLEIEAAGAVLGVGEELLVDALMELEVEES